MSLNTGVNYLAIPGPSVIPDAVLRAMHRASPNIYEGELVDLTYNLIPRLKNVARTSGHVAIYICNGHGTWEASLANMANRGDRVLVASTGRFAHGWAQTAKSMGIDVDLIEFGNAAPVDPDQIETKLRGCAADHYRAVLLTHVDTSSSVRNDVAAVRRAIDASGSSALLAVDCVASLGCDRFEMDAWGADVMISASQKGLMVPAGVGFVYFNDRAAQRQKTLDYVSWYWDWAPRVKPELYYQLFCGTAPTHHLYGLDAALGMIEAEGLENVWHRHKVLANAIWAAIDQWGTKGAMRMNIADPALRSHAVTALHLGAPDGLNLRRWTQDTAGLTLGIGLGMSTPDDPKGDGFLRFGHMGHVNAQMIMGLLGTVQAGLCALEIPHGSGAVDAAAGIIARG
ncbi:MAG: alanine--glyoxylate aminotransferase family protein [Rhodobacteraceae bacterium]|jgi:alanine-glyoxylate transaminase/serine-glyoxylate transaminase/serine-pyruvate transaminase|nr:alanine--glyoxylate aminotransferase family protein [Paracoccaceae bacterium]